MSSVEFGYEVHETGASFDMTPPEAAPMETDFRVVSPAGFDVPAAPGSPMCSLTQKAVAAVTFVAFPMASSSAFASDAARPVAMMPLLEVFDADSAVCRSARSGYGQGAAETADPEGFLQA